MADPEELLTVAEIASTLKMNQQTIRNWIDTGFLPAIRIGRRVRVKRSDFDALLEASYTRRPQTSAGVWDGEVPTPLAPDEHEEREASPPDASGDALEPEPDEVAETPPG